jgi:hypothetical protein
VPDLFHSSHYIYLHWGVLAGACLCISMLLQTNRSKAIALVFLASAATLIAMLRKNMLQIWIKTYLPFFDPNCPQASYCQEFQIDSLLQGFAFHLAPTFFVWLAINLAALAVLVIVFDSIKAIVKRVRG